VEYVFGLTLACYYRIEGFFVDCIADWRLWESRVDAKMG